MPPLGPSVDEINFPLRYQIDPLSRQEGGRRSSQVFSAKADNKDSVVACQRCDLTRPNVALSPWRQVRRPLRPDEHPCRQGTLLLTSNPSTQNVVQYVLKLQT